LQGLDWAVELRKIKRHAYACQILTAAKEAPNVTHVRNGSDDDTRPKHAGAQEKGSTQEKGHGKEKSSAQSRRQEKSRQETCGKEMKVQKAQLTRISGAVIRLR
jgi:hypothetical protein